MQGETMDDVVPDADIEVFVEEIVEIGGHRGVAPNLCRKSANVEANRLTGPADPDEGSGMERLSDPDDLQPSTSWTDTCWAWVPEENLVRHDRNARLCVATLLPFQAGKPDWDGFERSIRWMQACGSHFGVEMVFVLNADTGYIFDLSLDLYREVLERFRGAFPDTPIIGGVTAVGAEGETFRAEWYYPQLDILQSFDQVEAMIMTSRQLNALDPERRREAYYDIAEGLTVPGIVHALEPAFVPWATPFEPWLLYQLAAHEKFIGGKISTLDEPHFLYWAAMCEDLGMAFEPHSGDDFGIVQAIRLGRSLLIGAGVSACPLICAAKSMWSAGETFDTRVYKLFEALQSFEDAVFRLDETGSAAAYKHSTAVCLKLLGLIASDEIHPACADRRSGDEVSRMREAMIRPLRMAERLGIPDFRLA